MAQNSGSAKGAFHVPVQFVGQSKAHRELAQFARLHTVSAQNAAVGCALQPDEAPLEQQLPSLSVCLPLCLVRSLRCAHALVHGLCDVCMDVVQQM